MENEQTLKQNQSSTTSNRTLKNQEVRGSSMLPIQVVRGAEGENGVQATVE